MPKVLVFKETLLPPSETFILAQMQALRRFEPVLAGLERARPSIPLPYQSVLLSHQSPLPSKIRAKLYRRIPVAPLFYRALERVSPRLVHAHFASGGRSALPMAKWLGVPLIVTLHGSDVTVHGQGKSYERLGEYASKFVCVSHFIREQALKAGFPAEKLRVHHIGIDRQFFSPSENAGQRSSVLFVGRLVEKKGCEYLLRAMQRVQQEKPECELIILGDGPLRGSLEALARQLGVRCQFRGSQPNTTVRETLAAVRVFCLPSVTAANGDSEGLPTVLAEAQAMGIPVVGTVHGGIPEIVSNGVNGWLVAERDTASLAEALVSLLADDERWRQFSRAARKNVEKHFDLDTQTAELENMYSEAIGEEIAVVADKEV